MFSAGEEADGSPRLFCPSEWATISESLDLTHRESQIVLGVLGGGSQSEIAQELGISNHTIHAHFARIYAKLGVRSQVQLVLRVVAEYLAQAPNHECRFSGRCNPAFVCRPFRRRLNRRC